MDSLIARLKEQDDCDFFLVTELWKSKEQIEVHTFESFKLVSAFCRAAA